MSFVEKSTAKAKEIAAEDISRAKELAFKAASSGSFWYPIKGIFYFVYHRNLWKPFTSKILSTLTLSVSVVSFMFIFTYIPQVTILFFTSGPLAPFSAILLILSESSTIINMLARSFLIREALDDTFDAVLLTKNEDVLVSGGRKLNKSTDPISRLGATIKNPFHNFTPKAIIRYVMYLPLNFIPVVGTITFLILQGKGRGTYAHSRYFQLKKMSASSQSTFVQNNAGPYTAFGIVASLLEMVPIASIFFSFTNTVGAALWASDIEKSKNGMDDLANPDSVELNDKGE
ncbi:hypothetical protein V496_02487 [Pseudogymnoascus sp. VKM F-4515 (FW-2607)]|nr:hypothetical protein V496_02487 [Pseudogymnoascus sp. VKM F-4515 (FW-2607)]KFY95633.1 hypothetical protein V498_03256 [Pseudogymnoascus sp. VKM F-4517 (FW-2822)]